MQIDDIGDAITITINKFELDGKTGHCLLAAAHSADSFKIDNETFFLDTVKIRLNGISENEKLIRETRHTLFRLQAELKTAIRGQEWAWVELITRDIEAATRKLVELSDVTR